MPYRDQVYAVRPLDGGEEQASNHQRTSIHPPFSTQILRKNQKICEEQKNRKTTKT
jgi:hypothetical protein